MWEGMLLFFKCEGVEMEISLGLLTETKRKIKSLILDLKKKKNLRCTNKHTFSLTQSVRSVYNVSI